MSQIDYEQDRVESITQADAAKTLSDKVIELKRIEDEIQNAEESISKLKEQAKTLSQFEIPKMMEEMHITKLKLKDGESVEIKKYTAHRYLNNIKRQLLHGFEKTALVILLKMILPLPLAGAKTTRRANTQPLHKVRGLNPSRKLAFILRHLKQ